MLPLEPNDFADLDALRPLIAPWVSDVPPADLTLVRVAEYTFRAKVGERWRRGNIFLLGDAAHLTPPFIGQGMGAGLRDAMNLAWKLAGVLDAALRHHPRHLRTGAKTACSLHDRDGPGYGLGDDSGW